MERTINRQQALDLLRKYNQEPFHILHGLTVEGVMRWFAADQGEDRKAGPCKVRGRKNICPQAGSRSIS